MRRKDREKDKAFALDVLKRCEYATLAMVDMDNLPYCIPISPVLIDEEVYFHSATAGEKCDILKSNANVCLTSVCDTELVPERFTTKYKSAVVKGVCVLVTDENEKRAVLFALSEKYAKSNISSADAEIKKFFSVTAVYKIIPNEISGKGNVST